MNEDELFEIEEPKKTVKSKTKSKKVLYTVEKITPTHLVISYDVKGERCGTKLPKTKKHEDLSVGDTLEA